VDARALARKSAAATGIGVLSVVVGGLGVATAANGGALTLGKTNTTTHTTTLKDTKGTPLALKARRGKAPLTVNSDTLVKKLNAAEVGGLSAAQLQAQGSSAQFTVNLAIPTSLIIDLPPTTGTAPNEQLHPIVIVSTAKLAAGSYTVSASAAGINGACWIGLTPGASSAHQVGLIGPDAGTAAETSIVKVSKGQRIREYCAGATSSNQNEVISAGITSVRLGSTAPGVATIGNGTPMSRK
jgi:hypothetical protein